MGGSYNLAIRTNPTDLKIRIMWTNSIPYFLKNIRVLSKDVNYLSNLFVNNCDEDDEIGYLAPLGYGLIVIDTHNGYILDMQNYSSLDHLGMFNVYREIKDEQLFIQATPEQRKQSYFQDIASSIEWILGLANNQAFSHFEFFEKGNHVKRNWQRGIYTSIQQFYQDFYEHFKDLLVDSDGEPNHMRGITYAMIDWKKFGYTYKKYDCDEISSYFEFLQQLRDLNYPIGFMDLFYWRENIFNILDHNESHFKIKEKSYLRPFINMLPRTKLSQFKKQYNHALQWFYTRCEDLQDAPMHYLITNNNNADALDKVKELFVKYILIA